MTPRIFRVLFSVAVVFAQILHLSDAQTPVCCDFPSALEGTWYRGFGAATGGVVPYYTDTVQTCSYDAHTIPDSPNNNSTTSDKWQCPVGGETISSSFYVTVFYEVSGTVLGQCTSYSLLSAEDLRFYREIALNDLTISPSNCSDDLASTNIFRVHMRLPLVDPANTSPCPWSNDDVGAWQASYTSSNTMGCNGTQSSIITLSSQYMELNLCEDTNNVAGIRESSNLQMRCLRTWQATDMAGMGNDSLGTFFLMAENNITELTAGTSKLYVGRYLKRSSGDYVIAVDWSQSTDTTADPNFNTETAYTDPNARVYQLNAPEGCCNYADELEGFWYWGASKILQGTANAGRRSYYKDQVTTCELSETRQYDSPTNSPYTMVKQICHVTGQHINGTFYLNQFLYLGFLALPRCIAYTRSASGEMRFVRIKSGLQGVVTPSSTADECHGHVANATRFRVDVRLPLIDGTSSCPWSSEPLESYQATRRTATLTSCSGNKASVFDLQRNTFKMKICENTNNKAIIDESADVEMICLRTWQATEMDGKGNDSLGTFFLTMPSNGSDSIPYVGRYLKIGERNFVIAIDWSKNEDVAGFFVDANMDPETAYTETDARVYVLEAIVPEPTTTTVPDNSQSSDTGTSQAIESTSENPSATDSMVNPSATDGMVNPSATDGMVNPSATDGMVNPSATDGMVNPSSTDGAVNPSVTDGMVNPSATDGMANPSATDGMVNPSATDGMVNPSATDGMVNPSATDGMVNPSATDGMVNPSATDGAVNPSATDGMVNPSATDGMVNPSATDGAVNPSATDGMVNPSATDGAVNPSATDGMVNPSATDGMVNPSATDGMVNPSATDGMVNPSVTDDAENPSGTADAVKTTTDGAVSPSATAGGVRPSSTTDTEMTTVPGITPTTTVDIPQPSERPEDVGEGVIHVIEDFNNITGGNAEQYCADAEGAIATAAGVSVDRVDATCSRGANGNLEITTHISDPENPNDIFFQDALLNLERSQNQGTLVLPNNATTDAANFKRYILKPDGSRICLGDNCPGASSGDDKNTFNEALVYSIIGIGVVVIILTTIAVMFCVLNRNEDPDTSKMPFQEEDGFGFATHWQAGYITTMKPELNGGGF